MKEGRGGREGEEESARGPDAPLDGFRDLPQVRVAVRELGPRIADSDDRLAGEDRSGEAFRAEPGSVQEPELVSPAEPLLRAQLRDVCRHKQTLYAEAGNMIQMDDSHHLRVSSRIGSDAPPARHRSSLAMVPVQFRRSRPTPGALGTRGSAALELPQLK